MTRQKAGWQRQAARDLAEGRFDAAVQAFDRNGAVTWTPDQDTARSALVERWKADSAADPQASRFVFAYTNAEVDRLNAELREVRRDRGELASPDTVLATKHGAMAFAVGDWVQFTDTPRNSASTTATPAPSPDWTPSRVRCGRGWTRRRVRKPGR